MRTGRLSIPSPTERAVRNEEWNDRQNGTPGTTMTPPSHRPATRPFIDPVVRGGGDDPMGCVATRIGRSGWAPASTRAGMTGSGSTSLPARWFQAAESSRSEHRDMNRPAPNSVPCPGDPRLALVNVPAPWCATWPERSGRTAHFCLIAASPGGEARRRPPHMGNPRGHQRRPTVRC